MTSTFLLLCILLIVPAAIILALRPDLRRPMGFMAIASLPFAFTEFMFYPSYWEPIFLFRLPEIIGFGLEDLLFVSVLGAFVSGVYPFFLRRTFTEQLPPKNSVLLRRIAFPIALAIGCALVSYRLNIPVIWSSVVIMYVASIGIWFRRSDLLVPGMAGGVFSSVVYFLLCLLLGVLKPDVFVLEWHAEKFSNTNIAGVPLDEILYALGAGTIGSVFYPFVFSRKLVALGGSDPKSRLAVFFNRIRNHVCHSNFR